jgi:acyl-CoA reductase-like NAD-dependent aldehyde dehydrogenase
VNKKISSSKEFKDWSSLPLKKRCYYIDQLRKIVLANQNKVRSLLKEETGKKDFDAFLELFSLIEHLKEISKIARKSLRPSRRSSGIMKNKKAMVFYEPLGVAGIISPWNYPLTTPLTCSVEALLAGNNVILKPSEHTPLTISYIKELWDTHIGFNQAFELVFGGGDVGEMLVGSDDVDVICFTGSSKVGKIIAQKCSLTLKPFILELGGKDPLIVLKDANLNRAVESALFGGYSNAGQTCISVEEIFIEDTIFNQYAECISKRVKSMSSGDLEHMDIGSMIMDANCNKVKEHIAEINQKKIIKGESINHSMYIPPTLIIDPPESSRVVNEETFGPVVSLRAFKDEEDLLNKVHKTGYGLAGSIFGKDKKRIKNILKKLKIGNVSINDVFTHYGIASLPFGGEGLSGVGRLHGKEGLRSFSRIKSVVENRYNFISDPWWYGRPLWIERLLNALLKYYYKI